MNNCCFVGFFTEDPKIIELNNTFVVNFTLAVESFRTNKIGEKVRSIEYLDFDAWDSGAVSICKYFKKGDKIALETEARQHNWIGKDGNKKYKIVFRVSSFNGLLRKEENE